MHNVAILNDIVLALDTELTGAAAGSLRLEFDEVIVFDDLSADEAFLEVGVDYAGGLGRFVAFVDCPGTAFIGAGGEEGLEVEKAVGALDEADSAGLREAHFLDEHLPLFVGVEFGYVGLSLGGKDEDFSILVLDGLADLIHVGVACGSGILVHIADIHYRFVGQQEELFSELFVLSVVELDGAAGLTLKEGILVLEKDVHQAFGVFISAGRGLLGDLCEAVFDSLEVFNLELRVDDLFVTDRVHATVHMDDIVVIKAAEDVEDGVSLADIGEELVAETFALAGTFNEAGDVHDFDRGRDDTFRVAELLEFFETFVRDYCGTDIRLDCAEWEIGTLGLAGADAVEKC